MLNINPLHLWCYSFLFNFHINIVIREYSEPKVVSALSSTRAQHVAIKWEVAIKTIRDDAWDPDDIFLCIANYKDSMVFSLACNNKYICKMSFLYIYGAKAFGDIVDLDLLTDNCSQPFNPFYFTQARRNTTSHPNLGFVTTSQLDISELVLWYTSFTHFPPNYFCKLKNTTSLTFHRNLFKSSRDLGLTTQCNMSQCCLCRLENLNLSKNDLEVLSNFTFCGLPFLRSLDLSSNTIYEVDVDAFATLHSLQYLDLSNNWLSHLPADAFLHNRNLKHLNLGYNSLTETSLESIQLLPSLEELMLAYNKISQIKSNNFSNLKCLKRLSLKGNHLLHLINAMHSLMNLVVLDISSNYLSHISEMEFSSIANLTTLNLSNNNFTYISCLTFSEHAHVNVLDLSYNKLNSIPKFLFLKHVRHISLFRNKIINISVSDKEMFCNINLVESIDLSSNLIEDIASDAFDCKGTGNGLKFLNLNYNRITEISNIFVNTKIQQLFLKGNRIKVFSLSEVSLNIVILDLSDNVINDFSGIQLSSTYSNKNVSMKELFLNSNNISKISNAYFPHTLKLLNLGYNKLVNFSIATIEENTSASIILPTNIKTVDLRNNGLEYMCSAIKAIRANDDRPVIMISGNPIKCPCEMTFLSMHNYLFRPHPFKFSSRCFSEDIVNDAINFSQNSILDTSKLHRNDTFSCMSSLSKVLNPCQCNLHSAYNTICNLPCPAPCHCFLNSRFDTQVINCTNRKLNYIPKTSSIKISVNLYFSNNVLASIEPSSLNYYSSARELYFENNRLATIHSAAFEDVPQVVILNLQSNFLTQLPEGVFQNLTKLAELYLSDNRIAFLPADVFRSLISLAVLHLDNNALDSFPVWELKDPHVGALHLTLRQNPWMCECRYVNQFRVWLQNFSYRVDDVSEVFCTLVGADSQIPLIAFNSSHCFDQVPGFSIFQNVPLWSSFLAILLLVIVVGILVFVYRAELQVIVYSRYRLRVFHHQKEGDDSEKLYDAFVAFSSFDEEFVVNNLLPGLEQIENPYRICIHQRDFMVGTIITESIMEAVEKSRRTLIVLSEDFVKSGWCRFEFKSAHMKMLTDRCSRVIVIVLDVVPLDLDPEMQLYMKTNTYLKWGDRFFWQKLYFALPDIKPK